MKKNRVIITLSILLIIVICFGLLLGSTSLSIKEVLEGLFNLGDYKYTIIMQKVRIPRVLAGLIAGVGLSVAGVLTQTVTDNNLASPNIIGVNSGAGFLVILILYLCPMVTYTLPLFAFGGALLATLIILGISNKIGQSKVVLILAGIAITTILNSLISFISLLDVDVISTYNYFSIGGLSGVSLERLIIPGVLVVLTLSLSIFLSHQIQVLGLGDQQATSLGIKVKKIRKICLILACVSAAAVVSYAGLLGFVGLVVPNLVKKIIGFNTKDMLIASSLLGGIIVILADIVGRVILAPTEIPVGIIMSLIGGPFLLVLLLRGKNNAKN